MSQTFFTRRFLLQGSLVTIAALQLTGCHQAGSNLLQITTDGQFFSAHELTLLTDIAELMIPRTDTPGAADANVTAVLDGMMLSWAGEDTREQFQRALKIFETKAQSRYEKSYSSLLPKQRLELLINVDTKAFSKTPDEASRDYRKLKELIFLIYYSSEEAGENFVPLPGEYYGDLSAEAYEALMSERAYGR